MFAENVPRVPPSGVRVCFAESRVAKKMDAKAIGKQIQIGHVVCCDFLW